MSLFRVGAYAYLFTTLALLFAPLVSRSQALPSPVFAPVSNGSTYTYSGGTATASNAASIAFPPPANGPIYGQSTQSQPLGGGRSASISIKSRPTPAAVGRALGTFVKRVGPLAIGYGVLEVAKELGYDFLIDPSGSLSVVSNMPGCHVSMGPGFTAPSGVCADAVRMYCGYYNSGGACTNLEVDCPATSTNLAAGCRTLIPSQSWMGWQSQQISAVPSVGRPSTIDELEASIAAKSGWPDSSAVRRGLTEAIEQGVPLEFPAPYEITGPVSVPGVPSVVSLPDGSKITTTPEKSISYGPRSVTVDDREVVTKTDPSGVTTPVQESTKPATLPETKTETPIEIETCGLPGKPMCAVDGAGAPTGESLDQDQGKKTLDPIQEFLADPSSIIPDLPDINWAFALPASCAVIPITGALSDYMPSIDVCQFQPMFHDIMSMVWMLGGLFGAISLFMRSALSD